MNKEIEKIAKQVQSIINKNTGNDRVKELESNWYNLKQEIQSELTNQQVLLEEQKQSGLTLMQLQTEAVINNLEWILFAIKSYENNDSESN